MIRPSRLSFYIPLLLLGISHSFAQVGNQSIRFARERQLAFFQAGEPRDTIARNNGDLFRLFVPDTMKSSFVLATENAGFTLAAGDTLLRLVHIPGHTYELFYVPEKNAATSDRREYLLRSGINGAATLPPDQVSIKITDRRTGNVLLLNRFVYRAGP